jgi:hypothetical protein
MGNRTFIYPRHRRLLVFLAVVVFGYLQNIVFEHTNIQIWMAALEKPEEALWLPQGLTTDPKKQLLLSVPFYVYEEEELSWVNATWGGQPVGEIAANFSGEHAKHTDDYWFWQASLRHPMRTRDPTQAKLFVVPILMNFYDDRVWQQDKDLCVGQLCNNKLLAYAGKFLTTSNASYLGKQPHIVVTSHYAHRWNWKGKPGKLRQALKQCHSIRFENKHQQSPPSKSNSRLHHFPSIYVGTPCPLETTNKIHDAVLIASLKAKHPPKDVNFQDRRTLCQWLSLWNNESFSSNNNNNNFSFVCGSGISQCPTLAQAKFGFHVRGDTFGSQRLVDTILSGTVPIFTRREQYEVLPLWIDWKQLSYLVPLVVGDASSNTTIASRRDDFWSRLQRVLQNDDGGYQARHQAVLQHRPWFDWTTLYPFDTYMYMLQAELYPETRHSSTSSSRSAWILPPPPRKLQPHSEPQDRNARDSVEKV